MLETLERASMKAHSGATADEILSERLHKERYAFSASFLTSGTVYDIACGTGYGSALLAENPAVNVVGVDICRYTIETASQEFQKANLLFICRDAIEWNQKSIADAVISLETIEHVPSPKKLIRTFDNLIRGDGLLILSASISPTCDFNPFHLHDFDEKSLLSLVSDRFELVQKFYQDQPFNPLSLLTRSKTRISVSPKRMAKYYLHHSASLAKRLTYTFNAGFRVCYLTLCLKRLSGRPNNSVA